jgi:hypothetical protein
MERKLTASSKEMKKNNEIIDFTMNAELALFEKKKASLPRIIRKRRKEFLEELEKYEIMKVENDEDKEYAVIADKRIPMLEMTQHCFDPFIKWTGVIPKYSPQELMVIFDYFKSCISELNKKDIATPTKEQFCTLCGISTNQFNLWKTSDNPELREVVYQIEDYIANYLTMGGLTRKISEVTGIFVQKSSLGRKEATDMPVLQQQNNYIMGDDQVEELMKKFRN